MEIIRTQTAVAVTNIAAVFPEFLKNNFNWAKVVESQDGLTTEFHVVSDVRYVRLLITGSSMNIISLNFVDTEANRNETIQVASSYSFGNISIYKIDDTCAAFAFSKTQGYSFVANFFVDTVGNKKAIVFPNKVSSYFSQINQGLVSVYDGNPHGYPIFHGHWSHDPSVSPPNFYPSISASYPKAHVIPLIDPFTGDKFDHINSIVFAPTTNAIAQFNDDKRYFLSQSLALDCGDEITYIIA